MQQQARQNKPREEGIVARLTPAERQRPWRIVPSTQRNPQHRLYDLKNDVTGERRSLALADHAEVCDALRKANAGR